MWQVCPLCKGEFKYKEIQCSVCHGKKIIHEVTGRPPADIIAAPAYSITHYSPVDEIKQNNIQDEPF